MKIKPKCRPRGRAFEKGNHWSERANKGGKPFIKIHQKLSVIVADQLCEQADTEVSASLGLTPDATWGACVTRSMILQATVAGNVGAAHFLHQCTEAARVLVNVNVDLGVYEKALNFLDNVPQLPPGEPV